MLLITSNFLHAAGFEATKLNYAGGNREQLNGHQRPVCRDHMQEAAETSPKACTKTT